ncbi:MAG: DUF523 domain-containing protein [Candidatus Aenigmatarchaeota archaeon]
MILVSACLAGIKCNFRGRSRTNLKILELVKKGIAYPVCPEVLGDLPIPRSGARILCKEIDFDGNDVLDGKTIVIDEEGKDVTENFIKGAYKTLEIAKKHNIKMAYLNQYSPSCGHGKTLGGNQYIKKYVSGDGVTTALLKRNGIKILTDEELEEFYNQEKNVLLKWLKK